MASAQSIEVRFRVRWWVVPYIYGLAVFAKLTGAQPDFKKVGRKLSRGFKIEMFWKGKWQRV